MRHLNLIIALAAILGLSGCAGHIEPEIVTKVVKVPYSVPCLNEADIPAQCALETEGLQPGATIFDKTKAVLIDFRCLQKNNRLLRAGMKGCTKKTPPEDRD